MLDLILRERGRRLVHHDDLGVVRDGLSDLNHLPVRNLKASRHHPRVHMDVKLLKNLFRFRIHLLVIDKDPLHRKSAEPYVFHDIAVQDLIKFLVNHRYMVPERLRRTLKRNLLPVQDNLSAI